MTDTTDVREIARKRLETVIAQGKASAGSVITRVLEQVPEDRITTGRSLSTIVNQDGSIHLRGLADPVGFSTMHRNASRQLFERLGIPASYVAELAVKDERGKDHQWRRETLEMLSTRHLEHSTERFLMRSVGGQVRAVLSDRFRRLDSRPLLDSFVQACNAVGAIPTEGIATDLRATVRAILPTIVEPVPGEHMVFGLAWTNSDFGAGLFGISGFALRLVCLNGMVGESAIKQVHLGSRLPDDLSFSAETFRKDTDTMASATRDVVRSILGERAIRARVEAIQAAAAEEVDGGALLRRVSKILTKGETTAVKQAFEGQDTLMLPAGRTAWRFSNALSWVANSVEDSERRIELQHAAGAIVAA